MRLEGDAGLVRLCGAEGSDCVGEQPVVHDQATRFVFEMAGWFGAHRHAGDVGPGHVVEPGSAIGADDGRDTEHVRPMVCDLVSIPYLQVPVLGVEMHTNCRVRCALGRLEDVKTWRRVVRRQLDWCAEDGPHAIHQHCVCVCVAVAKESLRVRVGRLGAADVRRQAKRVEGTRVSLPVGLPASSIREHAGLERGADRLVETIEDSKCRGPRSGPEAVEPMSVAQAR